LTSLHRPPTCHQLFLNCLRVFLFFFPGLLVTKSPDNPSSLFFFLPLAREIPLPLHFSFLEFLFPSSPNRPPSAQPSWIWLSASRFFSSNTLPSPIDPFAAAPQDFSVVSSEISVFCAHFAFLQFFPYPSKLPSVLPFQPSSSFFFFCSRYARLHPPLSFSNSSFLPFFFAIFRPPNSIVVFFLFSGVGP